jgi:hypothetical protein
MDSFIIFNRIGMLVGRKKEMNEYTSWYLRPNHPTSLSCYPVTSVLASTPSWPVLALALYAGYLWPQCWR